LPWGFSQLKKKEKDCKKTKGEVYFVAAWPFGIMTTVGREAWEGKNWA